MKKSAAESGDGRIERGGFFEVGNKFGESLRVHDGAGKLVRADFAAFFEDVDIFSGEFGLGAAGVVGFDEIGEMQRAGKAGGAGSDDEDVGFELFALTAISVAF